MAKRITVISGGQTGVDRAALLAAEACGLPCGGWCPPGRASEDGPIPDRFPLRETPAERSPLAPEVPRSLRTEWNVRDADATLILRPALAPDPGCDWTAASAARLGRPCLECDPGSPDAVHTVHAWLARRQPRTLNVAGPSEGHCPGIQAQALALLTAVLSAAPAGGGERSR